MFVSMLDEFGKDLGQKNRDLILIRSGGRVRRVELELELESIVENARIWWQ